jgi:glycosyltransferase involved in cell wall biosynthesis
VIVLPASRSRKRSWWLIRGAQTELRRFAEASGARIIQFAWNGKLPRKKNWALENVPWQNEWLLIIDADERITPELEREIRQAICRNDVDGFYLNRRFWFLDGWINHCGYFPSWNLRLFRHRLGDMNKLKSAMIFLLEITKSTSTYC